MPQVSCAAQICVFAVAALYSGAWRLRLAIGKSNHFWKKLGLFSNLILFGSLTGIVALWANMERFILIYEAEIQNFGLNSSKVGASSRRVYTLFASAIPYFVVFHILFCVTFAFFILAKLMLLGRLVTNAVKSSQAQANTEFHKTLAQRLPMVFKVMAGTVVVSCVASSAASVATSVFMLQAAPLYRQAAAACGPAGEDTTLSRAFNSQSLSFIARQRQAESIKATFDAIALLLISVTFVVVVSWIVILFRKVERIANRALLFAGQRNFKEMRRDRVANIDAPGPEDQVATRIGHYVQIAAERRRRLTKACIMVLVTFPARAVLEVLTSVSFYAEFNRECNVREPCQSNEYLISIWLFLTPEFRPIIVALSSPLPMMLSLWLVTKMHSDDTSKPDAHLSK